MIEVHAKNAQQSEGKARIEEMAALKSTVSSVSNREITMAAAGMFAVIMYLRSLWSPEQVRAQEADRTTEQENNDPLLAEESSARTKVLDDPVLMKQDDNSQADGPELLAANVGNSGNASPSASFASSGLQPSEPLQAFRSKPATTGQNEAFAGIPGNTPPQAPLPVGAGSQASGGGVGVATASPAEGTDQSDTDAQQSDGDPEGQLADDASVADPSTGKEAPAFVEHILKVAADEIGTVNVAGMGEYAVGGADADMFIGSDGADTISAGNGDDVAIGGLGDDQIDGGDGDDLLIGGGSDDVLHGGQGGDLLLGGVGADMLFGGVGDDRILGQDGDDVLWDDEGQDILVGGLDNDTIYLGADAWVDVIDGGAGFDKLVLDHGAGSTRVDLASGNVETDGGPADQFDGIECVVAGDGSDLFDFSGLVTSGGQTDEPMFFQITNFGRGDNLRMSEGFNLGFDDFADDSQWSNANSASSELEMRINQANVDTADAALTRLSFRTLSEEKILTRVLEFDFDGDGILDLELTVALNAIDQTDLIVQA